MTLTPDPSPVFLRFTENKKGVDTYTKISFPVKYGRFSEIETRDFHFIFNLNHELWQARAKTPGWIHPSEWLKRTITDDWVYYSTGGYTGVIESIGEYYLPNFMYPTNSLLGGRPFENETVHHLVSSWYDILMDRVEAFPQLKQGYGHFCHRIKETTPAVLNHKAKQLLDITGRPVTVLPPDARHVDYQVIPLNISDGCLYKCRFCKVKNPHPFKARTAEDILQQIHKLRVLYNNDIHNYNALFLGEHDALNSPEESILYAIRQAFDVFEFDRSCIQGKYVFMFGSVDSFLQKPDHFFDQLNRMGCSTYINLGFESADQTTLDRIGKPLTEEKVLQAFNRMQVINAGMSHIEITCNFLMGDHLPDTHYEKFLALVRDRIHRVRTKGTVYLSPMEFNAPSREKIFKFNRLKTLSRLPTFLYIIQKL